MAYTYLVSPDFTSENIPEGYVWGESAFTKLVYATNATQENPGATVYVYGGNEGADDAVFNNYGDVTITDENYLNPESPTPTSITAYAFKNFENATVTTDGEVSFNISFKATNYGIFNLNADSSFTATSVINSGTFNLSDGAVVTADFAEGDEKGTIKFLAGSTYTGSTITGTNNVTFAANGNTAVIGISNSTIEANELNSNDKVTITGSTITAAKADINVSGGTFAYFRVAGKSTVDFTKMNGTLTLMNGSELTDSTIGDKIEDGSVTEIKTQSTSVTTTLSGENDLNATITNTGIMNITGTLDSAKIVNKGHKTNAEVGKMYITDAELDVASISSTRGEVVISSTDVDDFQTSVIVDSISGDTGAVFTVTDAVLVADSVSFSGTCSFTVGGESSLVIDALSGTIELADGAILTLTIAGGKVAIEEGSSVTFAGGNTLSTINNAGTITVASNELSTGIVVGSLTADSVSGAITIDADLLDGIEVAAPTYKVVSGLTGTYSVTNEVANYNEIEYKGSAYIAKNFIDNSILYVNGSEEYQLADDGAVLTDGNIKGYNAFSSLVDALTKAQGFAAADYEDGVTISVTSSEETAQSLLFYNGGTPTVFNTDVTIEAAGESATVVIPFTAEGIFLTAGDGTTFTVGEGVTIKTTTTGTDISDGAIYLNFHDLTTGEFVIAGNLDAATEVKIYGDTYISGTVKAGSLLWINAYDNTVTVNGLTSAGTVTASNIMVSSGTLETIGAGITAKGLALEGGKITSVDSIWTLNNIGTVTGDNVAGTYTFLDSKVFVTGDKAQSLNNVGQIKPGEVRLGSGIVLNLFASDLIVDEGEQADSTGAVINAGTINVGVGFAAGNDGLAADGSALSAVSLTNSGTINVTASAELPAVAPVAAPGEMSLSAIVEPEESTQNIFGASTIDLEGNLQNSGTINLTGAVDDSDSENPVTYTASLTAKAITNSGNGKLNLENASLTGESLYTYGSVVADKSEIKATANHITNLTTFSVTDSTVTASGSFLNGSSNGHAAKATFTGSTLTATLTNYTGATLKFINSDYTRAWATITNGGVFEISGGSTITAKDLVNTGTVTVADEATLTLSGTLTGTIELLDGATIKDSSIYTGGKLNIGTHPVEEEPVGNAVTFTGANSFAGTDITNAGTITINAGASISAKSIEGGSIELVADDTVLATAATLYVTADLSTSHNTAITVNGVNAFADADARDAFYSAENANIAVAAAEGKKAYTILKEGNTYSLIQTPTQETLYVGTTQDFAGHPEYVLDYNAFTSFKDALVKAAKVGSSTINVLSNVSDTLADDLYVVLQNNLEISGSKVTISDGGNYLDVCFTPNGKNIILSNEYEFTGHAGMWPNFDKANIPAGKLPDWEIVSGGTVFVNKSITSPEKVGFQGDAVVDDDAVLTGKHFIVRAGAGTVSVTGNSTYTGDKYQIISSGDIILASGTFDITNSNVSGAYLQFNDDNKVVGPASFVLNSNNTKWTLTGPVETYFYKDHPADGEGAPTYTATFNFTNGSKFNVTGAINNVVAGAGINPDKGWTYDGHGTPITFNLNASTMSAASITNAGTIEASAGSLVKATSTTETYGIKNLKGATINAYGSTIQSTNGLQNWGTMLVSGANAAISVGGTLVNGNGNESEGKFAVLTIENGASVTGAVANYRTMNLTGAQVGPATGAGRVFNNNGTLNAVNTNMNVGALNNKNWFNFNQDATKTYTEKNAIKATAIDNTVSFKAAYADIDVDGAITNSGTLFQAKNSAITADTITNSGTFEVANSSVTGGSVSTTGTFNVSGDATLNFALSGQVTVKDNAVFTKSNITDTESTEDVAGKLVIAANKTATFKDVTDGETTIGNTVSVNIENNGIINVGIAADATNNIAAAAGTLNAGNISGAGTITVAGQLTAASITGGAISITAAGKVAEADPLALTVTGNDGIANSVIDITVDTTTSLTANSYQYVAGTIGANVTFKVNGITVTDNADIKDATGYIFTSKGGTGAWIVKKGDTTTLTVDKTYTPEETEGFGINKFNTLQTALNGITESTTTLKITSLPDADKLIPNAQGLAYAAFSTDATINGAIAIDGNSTELVINTADGKTVTISDAITVTNGNIVLGYGNVGSVLVEGALTAHGSGYFGAVQIDGNATVNAALSADTQLWLRNGKAAVTEGVENKIAISKNLNAETVLISSGKVTTTDAVTVTANSLVVGPISDTTLVPVNVISTGSTWTFASNALFTGSLKDTFTLNGGSISFAGGASSINVPANPGSKLVADDTVLIENANFTLTLNNDAKLNAKKIDNSGKIIMVDGSATEINATAIVNCASAEVPIPVQKAIINAKNITAGSIENYGTIGNLEVENQKIAKLDVGTLTNKQYGGVFATALEADSIENSGEIVVTTLTITSDDGLIDNKAGGMIAQDNEAMTINAKAINNAGYISTHGGAITATAITNGAYDAQKKDGLILAGSISAGSITNNGRIEVGSIVTGGAWSSNSGELTVKNGSLTAKIDNFGTLSVIASSITNASIDVHSGGSFTVSGASTLTNVTVYEGALDLADATLAGATIVGGVVSDTVGFVRIAEGKSATFNGTNSLTNGADLVNNGTLTINAAAENCLVVNGNFTNAGAITINVDAEALPIAVGEYKQIISVTGGVVNSGSFNAGSYQVIVQNDGAEGSKGVFLYNAGGSFDKSTIVVDGTLGDDIKIGDPVNFGGEKYVFGITAFKTADEIANLTAETTTIKFKTSNNSYGILNLARTGVTEKTAPISVYVTKTDGTGTGNMAKFGATTITTDVAFKAQNLRFEGGLTISSSTVNFAEDTASVSVNTSLSITDAFVDFEGATTITGNVTITDTDSENPRKKARVNFGEETKTNTTSITGNVTITDADVDFDDVTEITGNLVVNGKSEIEFDRNTTVGTVTLAAGSVIEADQGYTFSATIDGSEINGTLLATNLDDENPEGNTTVTLGAISGTGTIFTDINSVLIFSGAVKTDINVTGLQVGTGKGYAITNSAYENFTVSGTKNTVSVKKYFTYDSANGLKQIGSGTVTTDDDACNVITATGDANILAAVNHSWTGADGETYYADNVIVNGGATGTLYLQGNSADQYITIKGDYVEGVYGGTYQDGATGRTPQNLGGNINITVESGTFKKVLVGGDRINVAVTEGSAYYYREADINLTINGGTFNNYVAAGMIYQGENLSGYAEIDNTNLTITAGTFAANKGVFGGNFASKKTGSVRTTVTGTSSVKIEAGKGDIILNSALYVGSYGAGAVGATNLTFTGVQGEEKLQFKQIWGGSSSDKIVKGETELGNGTYEGTVVGKRTLSFTGFTGAIDCNSITGFSDVIVDDSTATLGKVDLSNVSNWTFDVDSKIIGNSFTNDFKGDIFVFGTANDVENLASDFSWNVFEGIGDLKAWDYAKDSKGKVTSGFESVTLFGETATWDDVSAYASDSYTLSLKTTGEGDAITNVVVAKKIS